MADSIRKSPEYQSLQKKILELAKKKKEMTLSDAQKSAESEQKQQESEMQSSGAVTASDEAATRAMFKRKKPRPVNPEEVDKAFRYKKGY